MPYLLSDLFSEVEARVLAQAANALSFEDGARTAGHLARDVKRNEQAVPGATTEAVLEKVRATLSGHPLFQAIAYPKAFANLMVTRTRGGGEYGNHIDNALIAGARADVSFTLFLSDPDSYDGGALVISDPAEERAFKPGSGEAIVYPSNTLHRVDPVTRGERLVVIGWVQSWVRDPAQRDILFDLWQSIQASEDRARAELIQKSRSNLLRMWAG